MTLRLEGVSKVVGAQTHIHPTDLELTNGTMNVLLGPTLAGKTSLMRIMAGLDVPSTGRIHWDGQDVTGMRVQDRKVAMVYQQFINYPSMTVYENIASPMRLLGMDAAEIDRRVKETAELMQLSPMLDRKPLELSGGQQQRCALARALVKNAGLVLLDEPLANLDYKLREELRAEIPRIFEESGVDLRLRHDRTGRGAASGRQHRDPVGGPRDPVRPDARCLPRPGRCHHRAGILGPADEFPADHQGGRPAAFRRRAGRPRAGPLSNLADGKYLAGFRPNHLELERHAEGILEFNGTAVCDRDHRVGNLRSPRPPRRTLGRADPRGARPQIGGAAARLSRPGPCLHLCRGWRAGRPASYAIAA